MKAAFSSQAVYNVCVIGSGPAGIIVALEYCRLNPHQKVLLVEYGYKDQPVKNGLDDSIKNMNPVNHHDPYECTNKGLGGTSNTWGGRCVMYDEVDFTDRPVLDGGCTWDKRLFTEIKSFVPRAATYFECGEPVFNLNDIPAFKNQRIAENFQQGIVTDSVIERWSMPTRFGKRYAAAMAACSNLAILEGFEAREFTAPDHNGQVEVLKVRSTRNNEWKEIKAEKFVIAAGAQESTRILLRNQQLFNNLDNGSPPALGKYYQGHLSGKIASVRFTGDAKKTDYGFLRNADGTYIRRRFQFSSDFLVKQNLLNTAIWLDNPLYFDPKHRSGAMSFMYLMMLMPVIGKKLAPPAIAHSITKGKVNGVSKHLFNILRGLPGSLTAPASIFYRRYCLKRKLPGVFLYSRENSYALHFHAEQVPFAGNCMELGADGETLVINYSLTDADVQSVIKLHDVLDQWLKQTGSGELEYWFTPAEMPNAIKEMSKDGLHQSGTIRIADSPAAGVVDSNLKLFGTSNVFVCSSAVFPTSGQANPTFLLGAFAIRLADFLSKDQIPFKKTNNDYMAKPAGASPDAVY
jgi:choline dehydrogenase-like flavoprotein